MCLWIPIQNWYNGYDNTGEMCVTEQEKHFWSKWSNWTQCWFDRENFDIDILSESIPYMSPWYLAIFIEYKVALISIFIDCLSYINL